MLIFYVYNLELSVLLVTIVVGIYKLLIVLLLSFYESDWYSKPLFLFYFT